MPKARSKKLSSDLDDAYSGLPDSWLSEFEGKNPAAVLLGRLGGKKGGKARAEKLSAEQRKAIAQKAARARWESK